MRDPKRIPVVMKKLQEFWGKHPDQRLGQIICNLTRVESTINYKFKVKWLDHIWNIEDNELLNNIKEKEVDE